MAHQMERDVQIEIRALPGNTLCADCNQKNPQWASVSYGSMFCLECSGVHRSLGVHISFVRSITMDSWSDEQIKMMRLGGNQKLIKWFDDKGIAKSTPIKEKYHTPEAELYRLRLKAICKGEKPPTELPKREPKPAANDYASRMGGVQNPNFVSQHSNRQYGGFGTPAPKSNDMFDAESLKATGGAALAGFTSTLSSIGSAAASATFSAADKVRESRIGERIYETASDPNLVDTLKQTTGNSWSAITSVSSSLWNSVSSQADSILGSKSQSSMPSVDSSYRNASQHSINGNSAIGGFDDDDDDSFQTKAQSNVQEEDDDEWLRQNLSKASSSVTMGKPATKSPPAVPDQMQETAEQFDNINLAPVKPAVTQKKKPVLDSDDFFASHGLK